jgi:hypothetical protein
MASCSSLHTQLSVHNPEMEILDLSILWASLTLCSGEVLILSNTENNIRTTEKEGIQDIFILKKRFFLMVHSHKTVV